MRTVTTQVIAGRVNGDGTVASAGPFTARRSVQGNYVLTFTGRRLIGFAFTEGGAGVAPQMLGWGPDWVTVGILNPSWTYVDGPFSFVATVAA